MNKLRSLVRDRRGANMVEYILLVGVVALISIAAFKAFGSKVQDKIKEQGDTVGAINAGSGELAAAFCEPPRTSHLGQVADVACPGAGSCCLIPEFSCCWPRILWRRRWSLRPSRL